MSTDTVSILVPFLNLPRCRSNKRRLFNLLFEKIFYYNFVENVIKYM